MEGHRKFRTIAKMVRTYLDSVSESVANGDLSSARSLIQDALNKAGDFFLYHEQLGDILLQEGEPDKARAAFARALSLKPDAPWITAKLASLDTTSHSKTCGLYNWYPDKTGKRQAEGGRRLRGEMKSSRPGEPLVTIVTAVYDNPATLPRCLNSVQAQSYPNIEHIVVDGGSPQSTLDVLKAFDDRLDYYVSEPDTGIYSAMNKGIALARGDFICLLNSDDFHDPDFVRRSIEHALEQEALPDIVYSDFYDEDTLLPAQPINAGIMLGNLNINHCTFLVRKECYNAVGPYSEDLKIISDMLWIRRAFVTGKTFSLLSEPHFHFSQGGMSSGNSPERRRKIIAENGQCYRMEFPFLSQEEGETLYKLRFSPDWLPSVAEMLRQHGEHTNFRHALAFYVEHCFRDRSAFRLDHTEADGKFPLFIKMAEALQIDKRHIHINTSQGNFSDILGRIADLPLKPRTPGSKRILHYATVFSAPSETFIYDLLNRLEYETEHDNFILYQYSELGEERPYEKQFKISWPQYRPEVAREIFKYIIETREIDLVIAHFAINAHRLHERIETTGIELPMIAMTHGVDVFKLKEDAPAYRHHVLRELGERDDVAFTAVSEYLRRQLIEAGMPDNRITVVPNTVNERFFKHRKTRGFYDRNRTLKLLCIGRLIAWKGHSHLIDALAAFRDRCTGDFELTLVYGNGGDELEKLRTQADRLGLNDNIRFESFVNFQDSPDYMSQFDCYIHPSTYTDGPVKKSETFGVAVLEAIAAGLPVISSDAGGLPEVVGGNCVHARVVSHGSAQALCDALSAIWESGSAFSDNRAYAEERIATFSARKQIDTLCELVRRVTAPAIKAALFSSSTQQGAGYAAYRLHRGLRQTAVRPTMFTTVRYHAKEPAVRQVLHPSGDGNRWRTLQLPAKEGHTIFTVNQTSIPSEELLRMVNEYDIINLHWHARFLSVENIASLTRSGKPVVMTIRDMQPLTGGCHFFHGCTAWQKECRSCPQINSAYTDYPAKVLQAKRNFYDFSNLTLVTISNHTRSIVEKAPYFNRCRIETIPNSIETDVFRPFPKAKVRREFGLPENRKIIGYVPSFSSDVKGYRELMKAFSLLNGTSLGSDPFVMLVGGETPASREIAFDKKTLGYISDNEKLARAYAAADVIVVPSLEETFSNTAAEAISCGVPVVGFKTGAIPDLAIDGKTGYTYKVGDVVGLAEGIQKVLTGPDMSAACRTHAEEMLSFMTQAERYEALFRDLVEEYAGRSLTLRPRVFNCFDGPGFDLARIAGETLATRDKAPEKSTTR